MIVAGLGKDNVLGDGFLDREGRMGGCWREREKEEDVDESWGVSDWRFPAWFRVYSTALPRSCTGHK